MSTNVSGTGGLIVAGTNTLTLAGNNTYTGPTTINAGALTIGGLGDLGGGAYGQTIANSGALNYSSAAAQTLSGVISGSGVLTQNGPGTLALTAANIYTGPTVIGGGTLSISSLINSGLPSPIGAAGNNPTNLVFSGGTLKYTGPTTATDHGVTLNGSGGIFDVTNGTTLTNNGVITGSGGLTLTDTGTLVLSGANTFTGNIVINGGILSDINAENTVEPTVGGLGNPQIAGRTVTINNGGILSLDVAGNEFGSGSSTNLLGFIINQGGLVRDTYNNNTIGPVTFNGGTMNVLSGSSTSAQYGAFAFSGDITVGGNTNSTIESAIAATYNLTVNSLVPYRTFNVTTTNSVLNVTAVLGNSSGSQGAAGLIMTGAGTMTLSATNTYTGGTIVSNGTLQLSGSIGNGAVTVDGGTLQVSGSIGTGGVTVNGGTFGGGGTIGGAVTIQAGGAIQPGVGVSAAGTVLTVNNGVTMSAGSSTVMAVSHNNKTNDQISCVAIVYGGTLTVTTNAGDAPFVAGDTFQLFKAESSAFYSGAFSATNLPALSAGLAWSNSLAVNGSIEVYLAVPPAPVASFVGGPTNIFVTQAVTFTNTSSGSMTNSVWNFGDGTIVANTNATVVHAYANAGTYTVSLVESGAGGSSTNTAANYVVVKPKVAIGGVTVTANGKLVFSGTNGPAGQEYRILTTTNVAMPLGSWTPVWTNVFGANGGYNYTNTAGVNPAAFFLLVSP
jgi:autotransporter-associated beta strand protein